MESGFKAGDRVAHLYFGDGVVEDDGGRCYAVRFVKGGETKLVAKGHSTLQRRGHTWTENQTRSATFFGRLEDKKETTHHWRKYQNLIEG